MALRDCVKRLLPGEGAPCFSRHWTCPYSASREPSRLGILLERWAASCHSPTWPTCFPTEHLLSVAQGKDASEAEGSYKQRRRPSWWVSDRLSLRTVHVRCTARGSSAGPLRPWAPSQVTSSIIPNAGAAPTTPSLVHHSRIKHQIKQSTELPKMATS